MRNLKLILILIFVCTGLSSATKAQITSVSQFRDVKQTDKVYPALKNLVERHKTFERFSYNTFRADQPLTRGEFGKQLYGGLEAMFAYAHKSNPKFHRLDLAEVFFSNDNVTAPIDVPWDSEYYPDVELLGERYSIDLTDKGYFRPNATVTEKELYNWLSTIFETDFDKRPSAQRSPGKIVTRSDWIVLMSDVFDQLKDKVDKANRDAGIDSTVTNTDSTTKDTSSKIDKDLPRNQTSHKSREGILESLEYLNFGMDREKPVTREFLADVLQRELNNLIVIAVWKMKLKNEAQYFEFIKKNPTFAVNYKYSISGIETDSPSSRYKDLSETYARGEFQWLSKLGIDLCDADSFCRPEKIVTEKDFYDLLNGIFQIKIYDKKYRNLSPSNQPMIRTNMRIPLADALSIAVDLIRLNAESVRLSDKVQSVSSPETSNNLSKTILSLPARGKARITDKLKFYLSDSPCADLSDAGADIKTAFAGGGIWGEYRIKKGDEGDIVYETNNTCEKGRIVLLRVGTAIVTMMEKGIKRLN